jgi:hypothetical protein
MPTFLRSAPGLLRSRPVNVLLPLLLAGVVGCEAPLDPGLQLAVAEGQVELRAIRGSTAPVVRSIPVTNSGGGRLGPVTCPASPAAWLTCAVVDGATVVLTASPSGLEASPAPVTVVVEAPGGSGSAQVRLVLEQPVLSVTPATLAFQAAEGAAQSVPGSAQVTLSNSGAGTTANLGAIACAPEPATARVTCAVNQGQGTLAVSVDPGGLGAGTYVFPLRVAAAHSAVTQTVAVTLAVAAAPRIGLSRQTVQFQSIRGGAAPAPQTVTVSNPGGGSLGAVSCPALPAAWLTCAVAGTTITLAVNPASLVASPATVLVPISATGALNSPQSIEVGLTLQQPVLTLDANEVTFTARVDSTFALPALDTVVVTNTGAGTVASLGTLTCTPPAGAPVTCGVNATTGALTVSVNPTGLPRGERSYLVQVSAAHSSVGRAFTVRLRVIAPPTLSFSPPALFPSAVRGSAEPVVDTVLVLNTGDGGLGTVACPASPAAWLACSVVGTDRLRIAANPAGLTASPTPVDIPVTADSAANSPRSLRVTFAILQPVLSASVSRVDFTSVAGSGITAPASASVTLSNSGAGDLASLGALTCTVPGGAPVGCAVNAETGVLTITVTPGGLAAGTYVWVVTAAAPNASNGSRSITVVLTVT